MPCRKACQSSTSNCRSIIIPEIWNFHVSNDFLERLWRIVKVGHILWGTISGLVGMLKSLTCGVYCSASAQVFRLGESAASQFRRPDPLVAAFILQEFGEDNDGLPARHSGSWNNHTPSGRPPGGAITSGELLIFHAQRALELTWKWPMEVPELMGNSVLGRDGIGRMGPSQVAAVSIVARHLHQSPVGGRGQPC